MDREKAAEIVSKFKYITQYQERMTDVMMDVYKNISEFIKLYNHTGNSVDDIREMFINELENIMIDDYCNTIDEITVEYNILNGEKFWMDDLFNEIIKERVSWTSIAS